MEFELKPDGLEVRHFTHYALTPLVKGEIVLILSNLRYRISG